MLVGLVGKMAAVRAIVAKKIGKLAKGGEVLTHVGYLTVVYFEAHGTYGLFAGIAAIAVLVTALIDGGADA